MEGALTQSAHRIAMLTSNMAPKTPKPTPATKLAALDAERIRSLALWTARTMETAHPVPFGADILHTKTGKRLMRGLNAVFKENDPSSHAEVRTVRRACKKLKSPSLQGYTLYSTCEPCPMCMANALWAGLDRVVYGATIADANRFCNQIHISAAEVAQRSDIPCEVTGPIEQDLCLTLFTHPNMQRAFRTWITRRTRARSRA